MKEQNSEFNLFVSSTSQAEELNLSASLRKFLNQLVVAGIIDNIWSIQEVKPGSNTTQEITLMINRSEIFISLISIDYLNSFEGECRLILEKVEKENSFFYPVIINHCPWEDFFKLKSFISFPVDGKPVLSLEKSMQVEFLNAFYKKIKDDIFTYKKKKEVELELKRSKDYWIQLYKNIEDLAYRHTQIVDIPTHFFYEVSERIHELEKINNEVDLPTLASELVADCTNKTSFLLSLASKSLSEVSRLKYETKNIKADQNRLDSEVIVAVKHFEEKLLEETKIGLERYSNEFENGVIDKVYKIINDSSIKGYNTSDKVASLLEEIKEVLSRSSNKYSIYIEQELIGKINNDFSNLLVFISEMYSNSHFNNFNVQIKHREEQLLDSIHYYSTGGQIIQFMSVLTPVSSVGGIIGALIGNGLLTALFFNENKFKQEFFNTIKEEISNTMIDFRKKTEDDLFALIRKTTNQIVSESRYLVKKLEENLEYKIETEIKIINEIRLNEFVKSITLFKEYYLN